MSDRRLDHIIKQKLAGYIPDSKPDWEAFAAQYRIANAAETPQPSDELFRNKLNAHQTDMSPQWAAFVSKREALESAEVHTSSDKIIKDKLDNHSVESEPQWAAFLDYEAKLADREEDDDLDEVIKDKVEGHETTTAPQWGAFLDYRSHREETDADENFDDRIRGEMEDMVADGPPQWTAFLDYRAHHSDSGVDEDFDARIREEVEGHETTTTPQWSAFLDYKNNSAERNADEAFDATIREEVEGHRTTTTPQWGAFLDYRAQVAEEGSDMAFDDGVKEVLEGHVDTGAPDWAAFKAKKAHTDSDVRWDEVIKEKLYDHHTDSPPQWEKLLEKKRKSDAVYTDTNLDKGIAGKLNTFGARYNSAHWLQLKARLEKIALVRKQIFTYKTMEMIFVCLMAFTLGNHLRYITGYTAELPSPIVMETAEKTSDTDLEEVKTAPSSEKLAVINVGLNSGTSSSSGALEDLASRVEMAKANFDEENVIDNDRNTSASNTGIAGSSNRSSAAGVTDSGSTDTDVTSPAGTVAADISKSASALTERSLLSGLQLLETKGDIALLTEDERPVPESEDAKYINLRAKRTYQDEGNWWHIFNAMDNNYIRTPFNSDQNLPGITHEQYGYSLEILHSRQKGRWEVEAGLGYSFVNYTPYSELITYDADKQVREVDFTDIDLDFVNVPLKVKYHFVSNGRWSIFGGIGVNNELIAKTQYGIQDSVLFVMPPGQPTDIPSEDDLPGFYRNEFTQGIFGQAPQLPSFVDYKTKSNIYILRGTLSLGAERNVSDRFATYVRATYAHTLYNSSIGPFNDRLDKLSFGMGFKMRFK